MGSADDVRSKNLALAAALAFALLLAGCASIGVQRAPVTASASLPIAVVPAPAATGDSFVVWYSGVGGWGPADRTVAARLAARGLPVVGVDSARYFSSLRSPEQAAADLGALIDRYGALWNRPNVVLVGYSFGGAAAPLILPQLAPEARAHIRLVVLIAPSRKGQLVMRPWTLLEIFNPGARPLTEEASALASVHSLCIADPHDEVAFCRSVPGAAQVQISGGHLLKGSYDVVADAIAAAAKP